MCVRHLANMHVPFESWVSISSGLRRNFRKRSFLGFATVLIPVCLAMDCASAVDLPNALGQENGAAGPIVQLSIERCVDDSARDLDAILGKADVSRTAADGPPPFRIALNDTFAADSERGDIAKWIVIRHHCRRRFAISHIVSAPANAIGPASLQQASAVSRMIQSSVDRLIRALYCRELTYGEFARKKYELTRDAADLSSAISEAARDADPGRLGRTLRQLLYFKISWNTYLRRLDARQPGTAHIRGAIHT